MGIGKITKFLNIVLFFTAMFSYQILDKSKYCVFCILVSSCFAIILQRTEEDTDD